MKITYLKIKNIGMIADDKIEFNLPLILLYGQIRQGKTTFGLELMDRGESLGRSIFEFIDRAKAEDKTILATIVGEAPAKVPADVGVFVVEQGKAKKPKVELQEELV